MLIIHTVGLHVFTHYANNMFTDNGDDKHHYFASTPQI